MSRCDSSCNSAKIERSESRRRVITERVCKAFGGVGRGEIRETGRARRRGEEEGGGGTETAEWRVRCGARNSGRGVEKAGVVIFRLRAIGVGRTEWKMFRFMRGIIRLVLCSICEQCEC